MAAPPARHTRRRKSEARSVGNVDPFFTARSAPALLEKNILSVPFLISPSNGLAEWQGCLAHSTDEDTETEDGAGAGASSASRSWALLLESAHPFLLASASNLK